MPICAGCRQIAARYGIDSASIRLLPTSRCTAMHARRLSPRDVASSIRAMPAPPTGRRC
jgi:hypothetical protein